MMIKKSVGLLFNRFKKKIPEFFLVHPGGPYWGKKDTSAWAIPKGEIEENEDHIKAAIREMREETGILFDIPIENFFQLSPAKQNPEKIIFVWAAEADFEATLIKSNLFEIEWPPKSGKKKQFPEIDKADWFNFEDAKKKIVSGQVPLLEELKRKL